MSGGGLVPVTGGGENAPEGSNGGFAPPPPRTGTRPPHHPTTSPCPYAPYPSYTANERKFPREYTRPQLHQVQTGRPGILAEYAAGRPLAGAFRHTAGQDTAGRGPYHHQCDRHVFP